MQIPTPRPNALQRMVHVLAALPVGAKFFSHTMHLVDRPLLQATGGRFAVSGTFTGLPMVTVTTRGAKSGKVRTIPLVAFPDGDKLFLIASNWGGTNYPAWYHNLLANPGAIISYGGHARKYTARKAHGAEYEAYWKRATEAYRGYEAYRSRTGGRPIPIMVLEPV